MPCALAGRGRALRAWPGERHVRRPRGPHGALADNASASPRAAAPAPPARAPAPMPQCGLSSFCWP